MYTSFVTMLQMPQGLTQLHHHATCQTLGVDALQCENNRGLYHNTYDPGTSPGSANQCI